MNTSEVHSLKEAKDSFEKSFILQTLVSNNWNFVQSAKKLNIDRSLLYKKVEKYKLKMSKKYNS